MAEPKQTFSSQYCLGEASWSQRLKRDLRLLWYLLQNIRTWAKARGLRKEFQRCRNTGEPFYVDRFSTTEPPR